MAETDAAAGGLRTGWNPAGSILALVLGALAVGSEFGWGTVKTI